MKKVIINDFTEIEKLKSNSNHDEIVKILQDIMKKILLNTKIEIETPDNKVSIEPVCVEAYYKSDIFKDFSVHEIKDLQTNHFGKLYIHRQGGKKANKTSIPLLNNRGGIDLCLSDGDYYLSFLIREAYISINKAIVYVDGPGRLVKYLSGMEFGEQKTKAPCGIITKDNYNIIENKDVLFTLEKAEDVPVYFSIRINIPYNRKASDKKYNEEKAKEKYVFALLRAVKGM